MPPAPPVVLSFVTGAVVLALAAPAAAAPPWSAPVPTATGVGTGAVAAGPRDDLLLSASLGTPDGTVTRLAATRPDGSLRRERIVRGAVRPARYGATSAAFLRTAHGSEVEDASEIGVSFGKADVSTLGGRVVLTRRGRTLEDSGTDERLATSRTGDALVVWTTGAAAFGDTTPWIGWRPAGGPRRITRGGRIGRADQYGVLDVAVGAGGDGVVVLRKGRAIVARTVDVRSGTVGSEQTLGRAAGSPTSADAAVDPRGRTVVAWQEQDGGEEANNPAVVRAAFRGAGRGGFRPAQVLDPGGAVQRATGPRVAVDDAGRATVAWSQVLGDGDDLRSVPRAATATSALGFSRARDLLPRGDVGDVLATPAGAVVALRADDPQDPGPTLVTRPQVAVRAGSGPLVVEDVAGAGGPPALAVGRRVIARWSAGLAPDAPTFTATRAVP